MIEKMHTHKEKTGKAMDHDAGSKPRRALLGRVFSGRLAVRLPVLTGVMLTTLTVAIAGTGYYIAEENIREHELKRIENVAHDRAAALNAYLETIGQDMRFMAKNRMVQGAVSSFATAYGSMERPGETLRRAYVHDNPHPTGEKQNLDTAGGDAEYDRLHAQYHPALRIFMEERGYQDIFLAAANGDLIYSVNKEADFATNLLNGRWRETAIGTTFRASANAAAGDLAVSDFAPYAPNRDAPASFISTPVHDVDGVLQGVLIAQMPLGNLQAMISRDAHLGEHGSVFLMGRDYKLRTDLPNTAANEALTASFENPFVDQALKGQAIHGEMKDANGELLAIGMAPVQFHGVEWLVVARTQEAELLSWLVHLRDMFILVGALGLVIFLALATLGILTITHRMRSLAETVSRLADGENGLEMPGATKADELGDIARALTAIDTRNVETLRIKSALDNAAANVMVSDVDLNIVYTNDTLNTMLQAAESDIRRDLPQFSTENLIGTNIDVFHKKPEHQRSMLSRLTETFRTGIKVGGRNFNLVVTPILNSDQERVGFVVEWADITQELVIESEIDSLVAAAVQGDFSQRLSLEGKEGFQRNLADAMNSLCATTSDAINTVADALSGLSGGDLTRRVEGEYNGLFGKLQGDTNTTSEQLGQIVTDIISSADEVAAAADEISSGTTDLSSRTEQQASNLEETAASMEQMASTIKQNAENAQQANQLSTSARDVAMRGGNIVENAISAMSRIEESSQKVSDIIGVIDEIAFQTNLLALNAAVEAARAGDAGKGFAVVASEVRTLAQRSSQAAKDIKGLIVDSGAQVKDGVELVNSTGKSLGEIVDSIKRLSDIVSEISAASNEQATGVEEINRAVSQMDEMTQQNAALVEESAASAKTLLEQSRGMRQRMTFFKVDPNAGSVVSLGEQAKASFEARVDPKRTVRAATGLRKVAGGGGGLIAVDGDNDGWQDF